MRKIALIAFTVLISFQILAQVPSYVPTTGLVGWWPFNGNANDESGNGNNGTVVGAVLTNNRFGQSNNAYSFNANYLGHYSGADYIRCINTGPLGSTSRTFSFWVKTDSASISAGNNTVLSYGKNNVGGIAQQYRIVFGGVGCNSGILVHNYSGSRECQYLPLNSWDFFTVVYDSLLGQNFTAVKIYLNSNLLTSYCTDIIGSTMNTGNQNPLTFGRYHDLNWTPDAGWFKGVLDDIGVWNRALTQQEITALYNSCAKNLAITPSINAKTIGSNATFTASTTSLNPSYIWQSDLGQGFQTLNNVGQYSGTSTNTMSISNVQLSNHMEPIRAISTSGTCKDTSNIAYVKILDTCITKINDTVKITKYDTVKVTRYDTIKVTDTLVINATLSGVSAPNNTNRLIIYPNPAKDHITIDYGVFGRMSGYTLKIVNTIGQIVFSTPINQQTSYINLSTWTGKGMYYVQIYDASNTLTENRKIVLQ